MKLIAALLGLVVIAAAYIAYKTPAPRNCPGVQEQAAITQRAAEICTAQLPGCSLSYEQVRAIVSEVEAARSCK